MAKEKPTKRTRGQDAKNTQNGRTAAASTAEDTTGPQTPTQAVTKRQRKDGGEWKSKDAKFSDEVVKTVYAHIEKNAVQLEIEHYLERYLYPNLSDHSTKEHILSIAVLTAEKDNQGVQSFSFVSQQLSASNGCDGDASVDSSAVQKFSLYMRLLAALNDLSMREQRMRVIFLNLTFNSLEVPVVRRVCLPLVHLPLWLSLSTERLQEELANAPVRTKTAFAKLQVKQEKDEQARFKAGFLPRLLGEFVRVVESELSAEADPRSGGKGSEAYACVEYVDRFTDFVIDLLSQLPTRRFLRPLVEDLQIVVRCRRAVEGASDSVRLRFTVFPRLLDIVDFYLEFEINDHTGEPLTRDDVIARHCDRLTALQTTAFQLYPNKLEGLALTSQSSIESKASLRKQLVVLEDAELNRLAKALGCLSRQENADRRLAEEAILHRYCVRRTQAESFKREPLYPTEDLIWNSSVVPPSSFAFANRSLALPKLNLQFLTMYDYLLRNYTLYRLESTSEIRDDLESVIARMRPKISEKGQLVFDGWARMAATVKSVKVIDVKPPRLDSPAPKNVLCEVAFDLRKLPSAARSEWDETKEHDVMFLVSIDSPEIMFAGEDGTMSFPQAHGVKTIRGLEVSAMLDADGNEVREWEMANAVYALGGSTIRKFRAYLDPVQYFLDGEKGMHSNLYDNKGSFNLLVRRKAKENNFKAVLETIRNLIAANESEAVVPDWLSDIFLGYGDPGAAAFYNLESRGEGETLRALDFYDTFVSKQHLCQAFPDWKVFFASDINADALSEMHYRLRFKDDEKLVDVELYDSAPIYRVGDKPKRNPVAFSSAQVAAIRSGMERGLTLIVGPPGTGKTDVAVQIVANLYRSYPEQRVLIVTHSNHALNDIFEKIMQRDVDERHLLRLGQGERALATEKSFSKVGRVNYMLQKRIERLRQIGRLAETLQIPGDHSYSCETAALFFSHTVRLRWERFLDEYRRKSDVPVMELFPFGGFFPEAPFGLDDREKDYLIACECFEHLREIFRELDECRAFELLRNNRERGDFLLTKQARIIAMTCTHAAMRRDEFVRLDFKYDSLVMEEAGQVLEVETLIPMLLQKSEGVLSNGDSGSRLKRVVLVGDHNQLPPVVKNPALQKYARMSQSLFARFIRLGNPAILLDMQGRARPSLANLYRWRYDGLGDLPMVKCGEYSRANAGFAHEYQIIDVGAEDSESQPVPFFYQNLMEAEYIAAMYQYMRLLGYPSEKISVLTTYNGQKHLLRDVIAARTAWNPTLGMPEKITTVDKFQGRQNDNILLSLVRTRHVGHLRDVRRLVVAMSRARLGLYIFCRKSLFASCVELAPTFELLLQRPTKLELRTDERYGPEFNRKAGDSGTPDAIVQVNSVDEMSHHVSQYATKLDAFLRAHSDRVSDVLPKQDESVTPES